MTWQQNLMNNLIVVIVLGGIFVILYCRVKNQTLLDIIKDLREGMSPKDE